MIRFCFFLAGFGFSIIGFVYIISYLNLISLGYNFQEYVYFIFRRPECLVAFLGLFMVFIAVFIMGRENNELFL